MFQLVWLIQKQKIDYLDVDKLETVPKALQKINDIVSKKVVKNTKFNKLNTKKNDLEEKIPGASILIKTNQYNTDKNKCE